MGKTLLFFLFILLFEQREQVFTGEVVSIKDGDSIVVLSGSTPVDVRLEHIDCPEKGQTFGQAAKRRTSELVFRKEVTVFYRKKDRNGRILGKVVLQDQRILNEILISEGYAWHFKKYSRDANYARLESRAKELKLGLWSEPNAFSPWDYRKSRRKVKEF
jgi:micrococcal nuclease